MSLTQISFYELADRLTGSLAIDEVLLLNISGEQSDFARFNQNRIRQAGSVTQGYLSIELIQGQRHASESFIVTGNVDDDFAKARTVIDRLRRDLPQLPEDPYLLYATEVNSTEQIADSRLLPANQVIADIVDAGDGADLVGILAQGTIYRGFANSFGQKNWFASHSFNLDWSLFAHGDKAVKTNYAGFEWSPAELAKKMRSARQQLEILQRPARKIKPGNYRVYLAPSAFSELVYMVCGRGFGLKAQKTKSTCLLKMLDDAARFNPSFSLCENTADGLAPNFTEAGYVKPDRVDLIHNGELAGNLVSPRSAKEFGVEVNSGAESPSSADVVAGDVESDNILTTLDEGIYANQLWYLNWSDMPACRLTGMTRFATFWVEDGEITAPLEVMRFDESMFRALGDNLLGLTKERDFLPNPGSYGSRSCSSIRLPGAFIDQFSFTL